MKYGEKVIQLQGDGNRPDRVLPSRAYLDQRRHFISSCRAACRALWAYWSALVHAVALPDVHRLLLVGDMAGR